MAKIRILKSSPKVNILKVIKTCVIYVGSSQMVVIGTSPEVYGKCPSNFLFFTFFGSRCQSVDCQSN